MAPLGRAGRARNGLELSIYLILNTTEVPCILLPSTWPAVQSLRLGLSTNPGVTMWCVCAVEEMMCVVCVTVTEGTYW